MSARKNSRRYFFVFFIAFSLVVSPLNFSFFIQTPTVEGEDVPVEEIVGSVVWNESRVVAGIVSVQSGATLTISKGVVIEFDNQSSIDVSGTLNIEGTPEQPVILKKKDGDAGDSYALNSTWGGKIVVRNADISGGGGVYEAFQVMRPSLIKRVYAYWFYAGALGAQSGGALDIEGTYFHDNALAVYADASSYFKTKVWRSKFSQNGLDIVNQGGQGKVDVRYNWWGDAAGPSLCVTECADRPRVYEKMIGGVDFTDWATTLYFKDPIIIIPGIMGSWKMTQKSELVLDPVLGTYDELVETLDENGYTKDKDLFLFPYEWRFSNVEAAKLLRAKVDAIKLATKWPKVDIVAHSMGGLVAREYIETLNGGSNVDQLITLGTPHDGSPQSYLTWDGGEFGRKFRDVLLKKIFQQEAEESEYENVFDYVRGVPIMSVRELLPITSYLRDKDTGEARAYPELYPRNTFIEKLKAPTYLNRLAPVLFSNIIGKMKDNETVSTLRVDGASVELLNDPEATVLWGHGKPDGYDDILGGDHGMELGSGDGTVPLESAKSVIADETIELESGHGNLPTAGAKMVVRILNGAEALPSGAFMYPTQSILIFMPFSPIDVQVISPLGKKMGKNFETGGYYDEIVGAYYTGYDTKNEFITIPNPEKGEYKVLTQGTGDGPYRVETIHIEEDASGQVEESTAVIAGVAVADTETEGTVELKETGEVIAGNQDTIPPVTTAAISGAEGANGWYLGDVTATLVAVDEDGGSGVEKTEYSLDGGVTWNAYTEPLAISQEGTTTLRYSSTDKEGNKEEAKSATIKIDKTAPEVRATFDPVAQKLGITGIDNLGGNVSVTVVESPIAFVGPRLRGGEDRSDEEHRDKKGLRATLTDEAGHTTAVTLIKVKDERGKFSFKARSVAYDTIETLLRDAAAQYQWQTSRQKQYREFGAQLRTVTGRLEARFMLKKNETWIREWVGDHEDDSFEHHEDNDEDEDAGEWQKLSGMVIPHLETEKGSMKIGFE